MVPLNSGGCPTRKRNRSTIDNWRRGAVAVMDPFPQGVKTIDEVEPIRIRSVKVGCKGVATKCGKWWSISEEDAGEKTEKRGS